LSVAVTGVLGQRSRPQGDPFVFSSHLPGIKRGITVKSKKRRFNVAQIHDGKRHSEHVSPSWSMDTSFRLK
jgi:hypothetical protein